jgi:hypothetical protein
VDWEVSTWAKKNLNKSRNTRNARAAEVAAGAAALAAAAALNRPDTARTVSNLPIERNSVARQPMYEEKPASPYTDEDNEIPSMVNVAKAAATGATSTSVAMDSVMSENKDSRQPAVNLLLSPSVSSQRRSAVPDVASDILASQSASPTGIASVLSSEYKVSNPKGGRLLNAIRRHTASLRAVLGTRKSSYKAKTRRPRSKIGPGF